MPRATWIILLAVVLAKPAFAERIIAFEALAPFPTAGTVITAVGTDGTLTAGAVALDEATGGALRRALAHRAIDAGELRSLAAIGAYDEIVLIGLPERATDALVREDFGGLAARHAAALDAATVAVLWSGPAAEAADVRFGATLGQYAFERYRAVPEEGPPADARLVVQVGDPAAAEAAWSERAALAAAVRFARDLVTEPANVIYPQSFVTRTEEAFAGLPNVAVTVLDEEQIRALGMGALAGVGQGSARPPRLLAVRYDGAGDDRAPVAFVGKGITFDTGGISLKDGNRVWLMKYDLAGAASAIAAVLALAGRGAEVNVVGIAALAENMPSATAQRPGDVVRTGSGKTIEVISTDAEGRLALSDAVWYAQEQFQPAVLIDLATLTGSVITALGNEYAGLFTRDDALADELLRAGASAGEAVWRLPLHDSYAKDIASDIADIKNISGHRKAGAGIGAQVIGTFMEPGQRWAHLDIAGTAWTEEAAATVPEGAVGWGVRLLDAWSRAVLER